MGVRRSNASYIPAFLHLSHLWTFLQTIKENVQLPFIFIMPAPKEDQLVLPDFWYVVLKEAD